MKQLLLFLLSVSIACPAFSQHYHLVELDPATAAVISTGDSIPGVSTCFAKVRTYNETDGRFIFPAGASSVDHLYAIDVSTGAVNSGIPFFPSGAWATYAPEYDNSTGTLYGVYFNDTVNRHFLATIDQTTGIPTPIDDTLHIEGLNCVVSGMHCYDEINKRFFVKCDERLFSIDATTGKRIANPELEIPQTSSLLHFAYSRTADTLYGVLLNSLVSKHFLVRINSVSGVLDTIGTGSSLGFGNGSATIDEANQLYIYNYRKNNHNFLMAISLTTGMVVHHDTIAVDSGEVILLPKYDNTRQKLLAIFRDVLAPPLHLSHPTSGSQAPMLYPNPAEDYSVLEYSLPAERTVTVELLNLSGKVLRRYMEDQRQTGGTHSLRVDLDNFLAPGIYLVRLQADDHVWSLRLVKQ